MEYQTYKPGNDLEDIVKCYWTLESPAHKTPERQTIVPDGCMEMIFHYGDLYKQYLKNGESLIQPRCFVFGQLSAPLEIEPTGSTGIFAVRFRHEGFMPLTTMPLKELENRAIPLTALFGDEGQQLADRMLSEDTAVSRIAVIEKFLEEQLKKHDTADRVVRSTIETILSANGQLSIDELSKRMKVHRKQLERKLSSVTGLSPKQLSKIIRLQATLKMLLNKQFTSLSALAYEAEYYDQAHFIKDFKEFTGSTPGKFYSEHLKMSSLFYEKD